MEQNKITAEDFMKVLEKYAETCGSCKFFKPERELCKERETTVYSSTPKCNKWRYFA
jgi:hypothetical protein